MLSSKTIVTKAIQINSPVAKVWDALTNPALLKLWMMDTDVEVVTNWQIGSSILISGNMNGTFEYKGTVLQFEPHRIIQYSSWNKITRLLDLPEHYAIITFELEANRNQTQLHITHSNLIAEASYEHSQFYWAGALLVLKRMCDDL